VDGVVLGFEAVDHGFQAAVGAAQVREHRLILDRSTTSNSSASSSAGPIPTTAAAGRSSRPRRAGRSSRRREALGHIEDHVLGSLGDDVPTFRALLQASRWARTGSIR
jgi:hypothetical protein